MTGLIWADPVETDEATPRPVEVVDPPRLSGDHRAVVSIAGGLLTVYEIDGTPSPAGGALPRLRNVREQRPEWRCFFCDDVFRNRRAAAAHFGAGEDCAPACRIKGAEGGLVEALRETEEALFNATAALHAESSDGLKAYRAHLSRHANAIRSAEEAGYERGLADGRAERVDE